MVGDIQKKISIICQNFARTNCGGLTNIHCNRLGCLQRVLDLSTYVQFVSRSIYCQIKPPSGLKPLKRMNTYVWENSTFKCFQIPKGLPYKHKQKVKCASHGNYQMLTTYGSLDSTDGDTEEVLISCGRLRL